MKVFVFQGQYNCTHCRMLQNAMETEYININCVDPLGRSALLMAIDNENLEMVELLINYSVDTKDALLHAISEEFVEAVEMLLDHEDGNQHKEGHHVSVSSNLLCAYMLLSSRVALYTITPRRTVEINNQFCV